jgi:hypothetical protein
MSVNLTWKVEQFECYPGKDGRQDVVFIVHWRCNGADGNFAGTSYGTQTIAHEADAPFTPYSNLTEAQVIDWVKAALGGERVLQIETSVIAQIEEQRAPSIIRPPIPWGA